MSILRRLIASICVFATACVASAGTQWWELYTPAEQKKLLVEYEAHLYKPPVTVFNRGTVSREGVPQFNKALHFLLAFPGEEKKIFKAELHYKVLHDKEKDIDKKFDYAFARGYLLAPFFHDSYLEKNKLPDELIDEAFWLLEAGTRTGGSPVAAIVHFGPRAKKLAPAIREWGVRTKKYDQAKAMLDAINKPY